jgi:hypothetical protein
MEQAVSHPFDEPASFPDICEICPFAGHSLYHAAPAGLPGNAGCPAEDRLNAQIDLVLVWVTFIDRIADDGPLIAS